MRAPTGRSQWVSSWLVIRKKIKINMVSIARKTNKSPFSLSLDGILGKEALVVLMSVIQLMVTKIEEPLSHVHIWVNILIAIAVSRSFSHIICRACLPSNLKNQEPDWDPGSGLVLAQ